MDLYVSELTKKTIRKQTEATKSNNYSCTYNQCTANFRMIKTNNEQTRIHAWSHFVCFVCPLCKYHSNRQDSTTKHLKREHSSEEKVIKVDDLHWALLRDERPNLDTTITLTPTQPDQPDKTIEEILLDISTPDLGEILSPIKPSPIKIRPLPLVPPTDIRTITFSPPKPRLHRRSYPDKQPPYRRPTRPEHKYISPERAEINAMKRERLRLQRVVEDTRNLYHHYRDEEAALHARIIRKEDALTPSYHT